MRRRGPPARESDRSPCRLRSIREQGAQRLQPAVDADARGARRGAERIADLLVGHVLDDAQLDRRALALRKLVERLVEAFEPGLVGLRGCGRAVELLEHAEAR